MYNNDYLEPEYDQYQEEEYQDYNYYPTNTMPDVIKEFLVYFSQSVEKGKKKFTLVLFWLPDLNLYKNYSLGVVYEIQNLYENTFPKLSETYFEKKE